jgi:nucleoid DNA-binding protein
MKKKMTFSRLVEKTATKTGASKELIHNLLTETVAINQEELKETRYNSISGLGKFSLKWHKARKGRNPKTGESIAIAAHNTINFKPQAALRKHINRHYSRIKPELIEKEQKPKATKEISPPNLKKEIPAVENKKEETVQPIIEKPKVERKQEEIKTPTAQKNSSLPSQEVKNPINRWVWPIVLFLFIILFYIFWPSADTSETQTEDLPLTEEKIEKKGAVEEAPIKKQETIPEKTLKKKIFVGTPSSIYKPKEGDYLYRIALDYYKTARIWPIIYQANKSLSPNPEVVIIDTDINLPALEGNIKNLTIKDKKVIAEGYLEVYFYYKNKDSKKAIAFLWVANKLDSKVLETAESKIDEHDFDTVNAIEGELDLETH